MLAILITLLEAVVAFGHWPQDTPTEHVVATTIVLEKAPRPTPSPKPVVRPTPRPVPTPTPQPIERATLAPVERAAPATANHAGGALAAPMHVVHPLHPHAIVERPKAAGASGIAVNPGSGSGMGSGNGAGMDAGTGAGNGAGGTGTGAVNADAPCGYVEFIPSEGARIVGDVAYETIRTTVHFPDGHTESEDFPYPWVYANYMQTDPWSAENLRKPNMVAFAQLPPPGADTQHYPEIVRYVLEHTTAQGNTVLQQCPQH